MIEDKQRFLANTGDLSGFIYIFPSIDVSQVRYIHSTSTSNLFNTLYTIFQSCTVGSSLVRIGCFDQLAPIVRIVLMEYSDKNIV